MIRHRVIIEGFTEPTVAYKLAQGFADKIGNAEHVTVRVEQYGLSATISPTDKGVADG